MRFVRRIRRRLRYWIKGMDQQCRGGLTEASVVRIDPPLIGYSTLYCQKRRGHFGGHSYDF